VVRGASHPPIDNDAIEQIAWWWRETEVALEARQIPRARRFLRWILACCPDDEEAWLWMAQLASTPEESITYLSQAYTFHPDSPRVQVALRRARTWQLESAVGELNPRSSILRCLPNNRSNNRRNGASPEQEQAPSLSLLTRLGRASARSIRHLFGISKPRLPLVLAFVLPLLVYALTACSTVYNLDSAEFSAAAHVLGIVRATGYPLYLLLGKAFTMLLPIGDVGFRLNIMSATCAAGTVVLLYHLLQRLTQRRAAALAAALMFAFSYYFWAQAVVAEVYTLHTLLMLSLLLLLFRWETNRADALLAAFALLYGLSFGNHMSTLLLAPAFGVFLLAVGRKKIFHPRQLFLLLVSFIVGLSVYLYLPLRYLAQPPFNYAGHYDAMGHFVPLDMTQPANIWWLISGKGFQGLMFGYTPAELLAEAGQTAHRLWGSFLGLGLVPGLIGAWLQLRRRPHHFALLGLIFMANLAFFTNYRVVDKETMFVPVYLVWAVWMGEGFAGLISWIQGRRQARERRSPAWAWALVTLAALALVTNWPLVNVRADTRARDRAEAALTYARPGAIILGWWTSVPPIHYLQMVEEQRPDVLVINRFLIGAEEMYSLIDNSLGQRPVYVMELDEGLIGAFRPVSVGPMFELTPRELAGMEP
jgi:4-amino-4-deoxy-L-arabinose transferase-like glycosyltransferase